jgi:hypothetical protein
MISPGALQQLDLVVAAAVEGTPQDAPPATPAEGQCYIVGAAPSGSWAGKAGQLAGYGPGGWRFQPALEGMTVLDKASGLRGEYRSGAWEFGTVHGTELAIGGVQVVGAQEAAIAAPSGGSTVDAEARAAVGAILAALRAHGLIAS